VKKILVVDDERDVRTMVVNVLRLQGYETIETDNGIDALDLIKKHTPQLIISDVMMGNMNGFMLREILQREPLTARIPMILMSGLSTEAGAWKSDPDVEYISKPFKIPDLLLLVERSLQSEK